MILGDLQSGRVKDALQPLNTGVVDQDVQPRVARRHGLPGPGDRVGVRDIEDEHVDARVLGRDLVEEFLAPAGDDHLVAWTPPDPAASAYPVPLPFGVWLWLASPEPHLPIPASGGMPDGVLRDDPPAPRPPHLFRADQGAFQHTLVRLPADRSPWLREILENLTPHMRARLFWSTGGRHRRPISDPSGDRAAAVEAGAPAVSDRRGRGDLEDVADAAV